MLVRVPVVACHTFVTAYAHFCFFFERSSWKGGEETPEASPRRLPKKVSLVLGFLVPKLRVPQPQSSPAAKHPGVALE